MSEHEMPELPEPDMKSGLRAYLDPIFVPDFWGRVKVEDYARAYATHREQEAAALIAEMREALQTVVVAFLEPPSGEALRQMCNGYNEAITKADAWLEGRKHG